MIRLTDSQLRLGTVLLTTVLSLVVGVISLSSGVYIIFQNLFYIPIILACVFFFRRGLLFSIILSFVYLGMLLLYAGLAYLNDGLIRVLLFIAIGIVITVLAEKSRGIEACLEEMNEELSHTNTALLEMNEKLSAAEEETRSQLEELVITQQALKEEIERKSDFVMVASHELRTPLQPALGYLSLLTSDPKGFGLSGDVVTMLKHCQQNIDHERRIIDRILELSLLDSGKVIPSYESIPLHDFIENIIRGSDHRAQAEVHNDIPCHALLPGDPGLLYQVFASIIGNAVRYNEPPRQVSIRYEEDPTSHYIRVIDNGIGIDPEAQKKIFEPFHIADLNALSREYNRLGLGLPLAQRYLQLHGGDITLQSSPGEGSTFIIRIPGTIPS
ncbi:sensor histidine kinase [Methanocalculus chunghsingensis]|uniref:sensor histidine kinase n=1 Tax=Methanocalculus chunghsingensis TaxID=156457 RepID=UPI001B8AFD5B|nr:HAMP domain-containing sensor histidine kinase [Methanocalculus chunghsingensis]